MSVPYDYDQTNIEHLRAVVAEQERTIDYLHERCKEEEVENAKLRELVRDMCDFYCVVPDEPYTSKEELDFSVEVWSRIRELEVEVN